MISRRRRGTFRRRNTRGLHGFQKKAVNFQVKKAIQNEAEKKFVDFSAATANLVNTQVQVTAIPAGTSDNQRVGDRVRILGFRIRFNYAINQTNNPLDVFRLIVYQWHSDNLFPPTLDGTVGSGIFQNTATGMAGLIQPYNHDNGKNFTIVYDKMFTLNPNGNEQVTKNFRIGLSKRRVKRFAKDVVSYHAGGNMGTDQWYVAFLAAASGATTGGPLNYQIRTYFTDI